MSLDSPALLGALFGAIGLIYGLISRRGKVATSSIGVALSLGSIVLFVAMTGSVVHRVSETIKEAEQKTKRSAQPMIATPSAAPAAKPKAIVASSPAATAAALAPQHPPLPGPAIETWLPPNSLAS